MSFILCSNSTYDKACFWTIFLYYFTSAMFTLLQVENIFLSFKHIYPLVSSLQNSLYYSHTLNPIRNLESINFCEKTFGTFIGIALNMYFNTVRTGIFNIVSSSNRLCFLAFIHVCSCMVFNSILKFSP